MAKFTILKPSVPKINRTAATTKIKPPAIKKKTPIISRVPSQQAAIKRTTVKPPVVKKVSTIKKPNLLEHAFDSKENYVDKFKKGNIGGGVANFLGTGIMAAQSVSLNALNAADSVASGKGLPKFKTNMSKDMYNRAIVERDGQTKTIKDKISDKNKILGGIYGFADEVLSDPLELTPMGFLNDIKLAKGASQTTEAYAKSLINGRQVGKISDVLDLNFDKPIYFQSGDKLRKVTSKADFDKLTPVEQKELVRQYKKPPIKKVETTVQTEKVLPVGDSTKKAVTEQTNKAVYSTLGNVDNLSKSQIKTVTAKFLNKEISIDDLYDEVNRITENLPYEKKATDSNLTKDIKAFFPNGFKTSNKNAFEKDFRKANAGNIRFTDNGQAIDSVYSELNEVYGSLFPNTITNEADQLNKIVEVIKSNQVKGKTVKETMTSREIADNFVIPAIDEIQKGKAGLSRTVKGSKTEMLPPRFKGAVTPLENSVRLSQPETKVFGTDVPPVINIAERVRPPLKDLGADTNRIISATQENIDKYGALKKGETVLDEFGNPTTRDIQVPRKTAYGDTTLGVRTLQESAIVGDDLLKEIQNSVLEGDFTKYTQANKTSVDNAARMIDKDFEGALSTFGNILDLNKRADAQDIALGATLIRDLQTMGRNQDALKVAIDLTQMLSDAGRTMQAGKIAKRLSPEGRLQLVARQASKLSEKSGKQIKIPDELLDRVAKATEEGDISKALEDVAIDMWDQVPATWIDKANAWRYMAMLTNPKTHVRNIVGNGMFVPARQLKNLIGIVLERGLLKEGNKTKSFVTTFSKNDKEYLDFAEKDFPKIKALLDNSGKLDDNARKLEAKVFDTKALEQVRQFNMNTLDKEDTLFKKLAYKQSLAQYLKANKIPTSFFDANTPDTLKVLDEARTYAMKEAQKATYRDANGWAESIGRGKRKLAESDSKAVRALGIAAEGALPFTKTPINILRRGLEYSPLGLVNGVWDYKYKVLKGVPVQKSMEDLAKNVKAGMPPEQALDEIAAGLAGTAIMGLGAMMAGMGFVSGKGGQDFTKESDFNDLQGSQNYALTLPEALGGGTYTLDWAAPISMPFFIGVETFKSLTSKGFNVTDIVDAMSSIPDPMFNMSMLSGINNLVKTGFSDTGALKILGNAAVSYVGQYNPTLFGQVAKTFTDDTRRTTTSTADSSIGRQVERFGRQQLNKVPFAIKTNEPYVDQWGRKDTEPSMLMRGFENFVSPGFYSEKKTTPVDRELMKLTENLETKEEQNAILPRGTSQYDITQDKVKTRMTEKELTEFKITRGTASMAGLQKLFSSPKYLNADSKARVNMISKVYDDAFQTAKDKFMSTK